jgi:hypothetical protein
MIAGFLGENTFRYGYLKADTLQGIKKLINHAIKAPQY